MEISKLCPVCKSPLERSHIRRLDTSSFRCPVHGAVSHDWRTGLYSVAGKTYTSSGEEVPNPTTDFV